ncbi:MAG: sulfatase-like hydrolase/transferase [Lentisphaeria bacterium]|nr:sulfatase-like hydrolase/transferase [Lentisphaeria bacterium]
MRKNILFITSDQQHWHTMGFLNPEVRTPNLDRLAANGTYFSRAYTVNPTCTPTRASWITGMYPSQHGAYSLGTKLFENVPTVGDEFRAHGYRGALVGKAHFQPLVTTDDYPSLEAYPILHDLDFWRDFHGPFYGFDHVELARNHTDESHAGQHYALWMEEKGYSDWRDYFLPTAADKRAVGQDEYQTPRHKQIKPGQAWEIPEEIHYNTWIAERTNALLEEYSHNEDNFFLWASFFDPHPQYMVPEPYARMYDPDRVTVPEHTEGEFDDKPPYFALSQEQDPDFSAFKTDEGSNAIHGAGSHLRTRETKAKHIATMYGMMTMLDKYIGKILDKLDSLGLTKDTLVVFTSDHGDFWGQHGLTRKAIHHYEDLLRVPLIASSPGTIPAGVVSEAIQSTVDLAPTFLSFADIPVPRRMTGLDAKACWTGGVPAHRHHAIVENRHNPTTMNIKTYIEERHKITIHFNQPYGELYDLQEDPGELTNLWDVPEAGAIKQQLLLKFLHADMAIESMPMPRVAGA